MYFSLQIILYRLHLRISDFTPTSHFIQCTIFSLREAELQKDTRNSLLMCYIKKPLPLIIMKAQIFLIVLFCSTAITTQLYPISFLTLSPFKSAQCGRKQNTYLWLGKTVIQPASQNFHTYSPLTHRFSTDYYTSKPFICHLNHPCALIMK